MRKLTTKSDSKPDGAAREDGDLIPGIPDTFENVVKALVKPQPKKHHEWKSMQKRDARQQRPYGKEMS